MRNRLPAYSKGNLYYLRLKTAYGVFYKIGFTTLGSAQDRLNFDGKTDGELIDKVLLFKYFNDAYQIEQALHHCLAPKRTFPGYSNLPQYLLAGNGQSEIYTEDVLGIDPLYCDEQAVETELLLSGRRRIVSGLTQDQWDRNKKINGWVETYLPGVLKMLLSPLIILLSLIRVIVGRETLKDSLVGLVDFFTGAKEKRNNLAIQQKRAEELAQLKAQIGC